MLDLNEEKPFLGTPTDQSERPTARHRLWKTSHPRLVAASLALNAILMTMVVPTIIWTLQKGGNRANSAMPLKQQEEGLNSLIRSVSTFSPIFDEVDLRPHTMRFNGRLRDNSSIYRADPSPEADAAWDRLSAEGFEIVTVDEEDILAIGKKPGLSVKAPLSWGRGDHAYVAQVDVFHQVHCLNELRKAANFEYYYGNGDQLLPNYKDHQNHCIHMLLQNIMCHADIEIITHNWVHYDIPDQPNRPFAEPFADFNTIKKCRDYEALLGWMEDNSIKDLGDRWAELHMPEGTEFVEGDGYF